MAKILICIRPDREGQIVAVVDDTHIFGELEIWPHFVALTVVGDSDTVRAQAEAMRDGVGRIWLDLDSLPQAAINAMAADEVPEVASLPLAPARGTATRLEARTASRASEAEAFHAWHRARGIWRGLVRQAGDMQLSPQERAAAQAVVQFFAEDEQSKRTVHQALRPVAQASTIKGGARG